MTKNSNALFIKYIIHFCKINSFIMNFDWVSQVKVQKVEFGPYQRVKVILSFINYTKVLLNCEGVVYLLKLILSQYIFCFKYVFFFFFQQFFFISFAKSLYLKKLDYLYHTTLSNTYQCLQKTPTTYSHTQPSRKLVGTTKISTYIMLDTFRFSVRITNLPRLSISGIY